jgi:uncharacterized protein (TIRG00374 family)
MPATRRLLPLSSRTAVVVLALGILVYAGLTVWSDWPAVRQSLGKVEVGYLPLILALSLANYLLRFANWQFYLRCLGLRHLRRRDSFLIFLSGFSMALTPGKVGELIRPYLLKERYGVPISKTGIIVLVDRLADVAALLILAAAGAFHFRYGQSFLLLAAGLVALAVVTLAYRPLSTRLFAGLRRLPFLRQRTSHLGNLSTSARVLLRPRNFPILFISSAAWACEAVGFYLTFQALGLTVGLSAAFFIYAFSTLLGAVTLLPGGLGFTEATMARLLVLMQVSKADAATATILIRLATFWFAIGLGAIALLRISRQPAPTSPRPTGPTAPSVA